MVQKLRRHCVVNPRHEGNNSSSHDNLAKHAVQTILDQGHLCPLPLISCPIYWQYDHALRLYPLPDAVILGDEVNAFYENYCGCDVINPGSFSAKFDFVAYHPIQGGGEHIVSDVEFSQIE